MKKPETKEKFERISFWIVIAVMLLTFIMHIFNVFATTVPWWDETIYVGMAKWIYSGGILGYWETFRPVIVPFILGLGWAFGLPIMIWGKLVSTLMSLGIIFLVYLIGEHYKKYAGLIAASLIAILPVFYEFGHLVLTGIPATFFSLLAVWFIIKKRWYWAGLFAGAAFMTRFLFGVIGVAIGAGVIISWLAIKGWKSHKEIEELVKKTYLLLGGFLTLTIPYLISNYIIYNDFFHPFVEGSRVFSDYNNWLYDLGNWFYVESILTQNFILIFFLLGIIGFFIKKKWREPSWNTILISSILFCLYLFSVIHKETRFLIPVFVFIAIFAGYGIAATAGFFESKFKLFKDWMLFGLVLFIVLFSILVSLGNIEEVVSTTHLAPEAEIFYHYFDQYQMDDGLFIASNPLFMVYTDKPVTMLRAWDLAPEVYDRYGERATHVAIDVCNKPCEEGTQCELDKADFLAQMNSENELVFNSSYITWESEKCDLFIWTVNS